MLYSLISQFTDRIVARLSKGHEESITHFRNAEIEVLKGVRTLIDEEVRILDRWLEKRSKSQEE